MNRALNKEIAVFTGLLALVGLSRKSRWLSAVAGIGLTGCLISSLKKAYSFKNKKVIVTGGSRGLGLSLAWNLLSQGAEVTLLARDREELLHAREILLGTFPAGQVWIDVCDVTSSDDLQRSLQLAIHDMGAIDVLINNAGAMLVGPFATMRKEDYKAQMRLHLYSVVDAIQMLVPYFKSRGGGRILNICSMGGKVAVPHMLPYDASKFALGGFSQGVAAELAEDGIIVTTAYPTVMRTGSPVQAVFKGDQKLEYEWFSTLDNMPGLSMGPDEAAKRLLRAVCDGRSEIILSVPAKARMIFGSIFPELTHYLMRQATRLLPKGDSLQRKTGAEVSGEKRDDSRELMYNQKLMHDAEFNLGLRH
jgi:short-subunit dehydrogenase